jgi:hypothetical protein
MRGDGNPTRRARGHHYYQAVHPVPLGSLPLRACPVTIDIHISYFSLGDSRGRGSLPDTAEADIINSLHIDQTHRSMARYFEPDLIHELRHNPTCELAISRNHYRTVPVMIEQFV